MRGVGLTQPRPSGSRAWGLHNQHRGRQTHSSVCLSVCVSLSFTHTHTYTHPAFSGPLSSVLHLTPKPPTPLVSASVPLTTESLLCSPLLERVSLLLCLSQDTAAAVAGGHANPRVLGTEVMAKPAGSPAQQLPYSPLPPFSAALSFAPGK